MRATDSLFNVRSNIQLFLSKKISEVLEGSIMPTLLRLISKHIKDGTIYVDDGLPVLSSDARGKNARLATLGDMSIIVPAWSTLVGRIIEGRE